jgi:hypothetical protein
LRKHYAQREAFNKKYQAMHATAMNVAGGQALLDKDIAEQIKKWRKGPSLDQPVISGRPPLIDMSSQRPSVDRDILFTPPYEEDETHYEGNHLTAVQSQFAEAESGTVQTEAVAYEAGVSISTALVGSFFRLPANTNTGTFYKYTVKATIEASSSLEAIASVGIAGSDADAIVKLVYPDLGAAPLFEERLESAFAAVFGMTQNRGRDTYEIEVKGLFNPGPERDMLLLVGLRSSSWAAGLVASAPCRLNGKVSEISLEIRR